MDVFSRLMMDRIIFLGTAINDYVANIIQGQLLFLSSVDSTKDINIYINSPGGGVYAGLGIYDTMQYISPNVATICTGMAASMAAVLMSAGEKGKRSALKHSRIMIHQPLGGVQGQASDIEITAREIKKLRDELYHILAEQRMLTLTWNGENELAGGSAATGGLKPFGREALRELERCDIVADVSHLNDESFWNVVKAARRPLVATHSNSRKICNVPRNLTDDQFRCLAQQGGLVGLNFFTGFLREDAKSARLEDILRHAEHFLNLGGEDVLALGSDFDGADMPHDLPDCGALPQLAQRLREAFGFTLTEKICYKNALDFWRRYDAK